MPAFSSEIIDELKFYVYIYSDPDTRIPFYIGKGTANRCFQHLYDDSETEKQKKIKELQLLNKEPIIELLRYGLTDNEASILEAALIDFIDLKFLTNKMRGKHSRSLGRVNVKDLIQQATASDAVFLQDNVLLITINKLYRSAISKNELYQATRGIWKVGKRRDKVEYVCAIYQGIIREAYRIKQWYSAGTLQYDYRDLSDLSTLYGRWEFEGELADETRRESWIGKSVRKYLTRGSQNPIKYINC